VVDDALGLAMEHGADLEVALEFAKGFFDFEEVFVVALNLRGIGPGDGEVGVEEIPTVVGGLGGDGVLLVFPVKDADIVDTIGEVFVGLELLECASSLAGDFLGVGLGALGCGKFGEGGFGFGDAEFPAFPVALFTPGASGDDMALACVLDLAMAFLAGGEMICDVLHADAAGLLEARGFSPRRHLKRMAFPYSPDCLCAETVWCAAGFELG
jgi:hypothetical protein